MLLCNSIEIFHKNLNSFILYNTDVVSMREFDNKEEGRIKPSDVPRIRGHTGVGGGHCSQKARNARGGVKGM